MKDAEGRGRTFWQRVLGGITGPGYVFLGTKPEEAPLWAQLLWSPAEGAGNVVQVGVEKCQALGAAVKHWVTDPKGAASDLVTGLYLLVTGDPETWGAIRDYFVERGKEWRDDPSKASARVFWDAVELIVTKKAGEFARGKLCRRSPGASAPSRLFGHNEYVVGDAALAARVKQGLEAYYKRHAPKGATIRWVDNVPGGRNGYIDTVTGDIRLSKDLLTPKYRHLADGVLVEELQHFQQLHSRGWIGRNLTAAENALLEQEVVRRMQCSGFRIFDPRRP
jgi:hypothetical protein